MPDTVGPGRFVPSISQGSGSLFKGPAVLASLCGDSRTKAERKLWKYLPFKGGAAVGGVLLITSMLRRVQ